MAENMTIGEHLQAKGVKVPKGPVPVKAGEVVEVHCFNEAKRPNTAVAKVDGFILFVQGAKRGDTVKAKITRIFPNYGQAVVVQNGQDPVKKTG